MRRLAPLAALLATAAVLSGCVKIESQSEEQLDTIGNVRLTTMVCVSGQDNDPNSDCKAKDTNSQAEGGLSGDGQLLVAYRITTDVVAPPTISASYLAPHSGSITLTRSDSYTRQMGTYAPRRGGERWIGYISPRIP